MAVDPKKFFVQGLIVIITIKNKPYQGVIVGEEKGGFKVRLARPDQTLMTLMLNSNCPVQCITDDGLAYRFECHLLSKKIPHMGLQYPTQELTGVSVRKHQRTSISFWTAIQEPVGGSETEFKNAGEGNIVDMSEGGCRLMTSNKLKVNSYVFLSFEYKDGAPPFRFKGKIRQIRPAPHSLIYYGIQFTDTSPEFTKTVKTILENPEL